MSARQKSGFISRETNDFSIQNWWRDFKFGSSTNQISNKRRVIGIVDDNPDK